MTIMADKVVEEAALQHGKEQDEAWQRWLERKMHRKACKATRVATSERKAARETRLNRMRRFSSTLSLESLESVASHESSSAAVPTHDSLVSFCSAYVNLEYHFEMDFPLAENFSNRHDSKEQAWNVEVVTRRRDWSIGT